jgi:chemotaxis protein MotA
MKSHVIGLFLGFAIVYFAMAHTGNDSMTYLDPMAFVIVFGGSLSVSIMTNGFFNTVKFCGLFFKVFSTQKFNNLDITKELVAIARKKHYGELDYNNISPGTYHPFVMDGLRLLHNKFDTEKLKTIMINMMVQRQENHEKVIDKIEVLAKYPPAFGMMGTIIGLVSVLKQINSPDNMSSIGPSMAIALVTTLYGILLANYVFQPIADNLTVRSQNDIKIRQLIAEGIILIADDNDPIYVRECLLSFLSPEERKKFSQLHSASEVNEEVAA